MGLYGERILPLLVDWVLRDPEVAEQRRALLGELSGTVLEVGFGTGLNLPYYPRAVTRLYVLEPSGGMMPRARRRIARAPFPVEVLPYSGEGPYPLPDAAVDAAVSTFTLCTIPRPEAALAEIRRVLKPRAPFVFLEHGADADPRVLRWQQRLTPVQRMVGGGCHLDRPIAELIRREVFPDAMVQRFRFDDWPRLAGDIYRGRAVKAA